MVTRAWRWFLRKWSQIPILGPLAYCSWANHKASFREFVVTIAFSTVTFWLTALFMKAFSQYSHTSYADMLTETVSSGQLFIFSVAFMGPIVLTAVDDPKNAKAFPGRMWHVLALIIVAIVASALYSLEQTSRITGITSLLNTSFLIHASYVLAVVAIVLRYLAAVYRRQSFDPERELKGSEDSFAAKFSEHRRAEA